MKKLEKSHLSWKEEMNKMYEKKLKEVEEKMREAESNEERKKIFKGYEGEARKAIDDAEEGGDREKLKEAINNMYMLYEVAQRYSDDYVFLERIIDMSKIWEALAFRKGIGHEIKVIEIPEEAKEILRREIMREEQIIREEREIIELKKKRTEIIPKSILKGKYRIINVGKEGVEIINIRDEERLKEYFEMYPESGVEIVKAMEEARKVYKESEREHPSEKRTGPTPEGMYA